MCERGEGENREGKDADSRMCRTHEAAELCRTEGAETEKTGKVYIHCLLTPNGAFAECH